MTAQTFSKPVVTIPRQPGPPKAPYEGLFLEPAWLPIDEDPDADEDDYEDAA